MASRALSSAAGALHAASAALTRSRGVLWGLNTLLAGSATAAAAVGAAKACEEEVPYADGRRRYMPPAWALPAFLRASPTTVDDLAVYFPPIKQQWEGRQLVPLPPGEVKISWVQPAYEDDLLCHDWLRPVVEKAARAVATATQQEVEESGFGRHTLEWGWHVVVLPTPEVQACGLEDGVIVLTTGLIYHCYNHSTHPEAALCAVIAHECGHWVARHVHEDRVHGTGIGFVAHELVFKRFTSEGNEAQAHLELASLDQATKWRHEFEADEMACGILARLRVPPAAMGAYLEAARLEEEEQIPADREFVAKQLNAGEQHQQESANRLGIAPDQWVMELELMERDLSSGTAEASKRMNRRLVALILKRKAAEQAEAQGSSSATASGDSTTGASEATAPSKAVLGLSAPHCIKVGNSLVPVAVFHDCPDAALDAVLHMLLETHPPHQARLDRIAQLAARPDFQQRYTSRPLPLAGSYVSGISVADRLAEQLQAGLTPERRQRLQTLKEANKQRHAQRRAQQTGK